MLRVISQSPTDVQPVFDAIARNALALCSGKIGGVFRYQDGLIHLAAVHGTTDEAEAQVRGRFPVAPGDGTLVGRVIRDRDVVNVADLDDDPRVPAPVRESGRVQGVRSQLIVPMLRDGDPIGAVAVSRAEAREFSESHIALLRPSPTRRSSRSRTCVCSRSCREEPRPHRGPCPGDRVPRAADRDERDPAVISSSPTDLQPVMDVVAGERRTILRCDGCRGLRLEGESLLARRDAWPHPGSCRSARPSPPIPRSATGRAVRDRQPIHIEDLSAARDGVPRDVGPRQRASPSAPIRTMTGHPAPARRHAHRRHLDAAKSRGRPSPTSRSGWRRPSPTRR